MTGTDRSERAAWWADTSFLREIQYKTDVNLAARQSIYVYQQPPVDLIGRVLELAATTGTEVVADIGCSAAGPCGTRAAPDHPSGRPADCRPER